MPIIKLTHTGGDPIYVNTENIDHFSATDGKSYIETTGSMAFSSESYDCNAAINVKETPEEIASIIDAHKRAEWDDIAQANAYAAARLY